MCLGCIFQEIVTIIDETVNIRLKVTLKHSAQTSHGKFFFKHVHSKSLNVKKKRIEVLKWFENSSLGRWFDKVVSSVHASFSPLSLSLCPCTNVAL